MKIAHKYFVFVINTKIALKFGDLGWQSHRKDQRIFVIQNELFDSQSDMVRQLAETSNFQDIFHPFTRRYLYKPPLIITTIGCLVSFAKIESNDDFGANPS